jgi:hypothetical protein
MEENTMSTRALSTDDAVSGGSRTPAAAVDPVGRLTQLLRRFEQRSRATRGWLRTGEGAAPEPGVLQLESALESALEQLDRLEELALPPAEERAAEAMRPPPRDAALAAAVRGDAERQVLELPMVGAGEAAELLGAKPSNREKVRLLRVEGVLLGLPRSSRELTHYRYPTFQFEASRHTVNATVAQVNKLLGAVEDPWGVASWWVAPNGWLGEAPYRCLAERAHDVVSAAEAAVEWIG